MYGRNFFFFIEEAVRLIVPFVLVNDILSSDESKQVKLRLIEKSEERESTDFFISEGNDCHFFTFS